MSQTKGLLRQVDEAESETLKRITTAWRNSAFGLDLIDGVVSSNPQMRQKEIPLLSLRDRRDREEDLPNLIISPFILASLYSACLRIKKS